MFALNSLDYVDETLLKNAFSDILRETLLSFEKNRAPVKKGGIF